MFQVRALKEQIESEKGQDAYPVAGQKLIYAGQRDKIVCLIFWTFDCVFWNFLHLCSLC